MEKVLAIILVGWPAAFASFVLTVLAVRRLAVRTALAGVLIGTPFLMYLSMSERFRYFGPIALLLYYSVPMAVRSRRRLVAFVCIAPFTALAVIVAWLAIQSL